jgi:GTP-binding protein
VRTIATATFLGAASAPGRFPAPTGPEVAFAGRSNVGKSSAINRLLGRRNLARTSSTPGRTQQLNFFLIDERAVFVDLPGYGYARVSKEARAAWRPLVESYLGARGVLRGVVLLIDARRGPEQEEHDLLGYLAARGLPALLVATKVDKLNRRERDRAAADLAALGIPVVLFSAVTGEGVDAVWKTLDAWLAEAVASSSPRRSGRRDTPTPAAHARRR